MPQIHFGTEAQLDPQGHAGHPEVALRGGGGSGRGSTRVTEARTRWTPTTLPTFHASPPPQHDAEGSQHAEAAVRGCQRPRLGDHHERYTRSHLEPDASAAGLATRLALLPQLPA